MASTLEQWVQDVRVIPYGDPTPTAPNLGEEDLLHNFVKSNGDDDFKVWNGSSFFPSTGPKPHKSI